MSEPNTSPIPFAMESPNTANKPKQHVHFDFGVPAHEEQPSTGSFALPLDSQLEEEITYQDTHSMPTHLLRNLPVRKPRPTAIYIHKHECAAVYQDMENFELENPRFRYNFAHDLVPVSPKGMSEYYEQLREYEMDDDMSCSNYSPVSTEPTSPLTLDQELVMYSPLEWTDDKRNPFDELDRFIAEDARKVFFLATVDFFTSLDVEAFLEPTTHFFEDLDELMKRPPICELTPHYEKNCCRCYPCTAAAVAREFGHKAHDYNVFCSCADCGVVEMKRGIKQIEANFEKERNAARARRGNLG